METDTIHPVVKRLFIWSAPILFVICTITLVGIMRFIPPPHPDWSAERIAAV